MKRMILTLLFLLILQATGKVAFSSESNVINNQKLPSRLFGTILINVYTFDNFFEFKLQDGNLLKTNDGRVVSFQKEGIWISMSDNFKDIFNRERRYHYEMEEKLAAILSQYDLEKFEELRSRYIQNKGNLEGEGFFLIGPGKKLKYFSGQYADRFIPNRQFSHVIYYIHPFASALIDLTTKEISFPFGIEGLRYVVWSNNSQSVAYSVRDDKNPRQETLVVWNLNTNMTIFRKKLFFDRYTQDITWSPDLSYVALLTSTGRTGLLPWELLFAIAGHPVVYNRFYLEVYDLSGSLVYESEITSGVKNGSGRIVWCR